MDENATPARETYPGLDEQANFGTPARSIEIEAALDEIDRLRRGRGSVLVCHEYEEGEEFKLFGGIARMQNADRVRRVRIYVDGPQGKMIYVCPGDPTIDPTAMVTVEARDWTDEEAGIK